MESFRDLGYVARHLAVTMQAVRGWADSPTAGFPLPVAEVLSRPDQKTPTPLWMASQLPALRSWLAARLNVSDPGAYWRTIDEGRKPPGDHLDQMPLFPMEDQ